MATSTQDMVRPGECVDLFYYDAETSKKQCFPTTQNTKFVQQFQGLGAGSSVFTIPPNQGIQDVVVELAYNTAVVAGGQTLAIPRGWGYALIKQVSFRYGGSSQYFLTGDQILQNALRKQPNRSAVNDLFTLGGQYYDQATTVPITTAGVLTAGVVLTLPHSIPSGVGKAHPLPSDLLTQQIQITVELNDPASIFAAVGAVPPTLNKAQFVVQQVCFNNMGDALARRVDMSVNAYAFPCEFVQQKQTITGIQNNLNASELVLTGFRSGEVKSLQVWLTRQADLNAGNPFKWYLPSSIQMTYAGDVYARYENSSSPLWNLINGNKAPVVDNLTLVLPPAGNPTAFASQWVELPFAQTLVDEDSHYTLIHGKPITNGIINLSVVPPSAQADWILNVSYIYNATLLFSQGTADYVF